MDPRDSVGGKSDALAVNMQVCLIIPRSLCHGLAEFPLNQKFVCHLILCF